MRIIVGRADDCDIVVKDSYASPHHCEISDERGYWTVRDLGSTNGTHLASDDGPYDNIRDLMRLRPVPLGATVRLGIGDRIHVGRTTLPPWDRS